MGVAILDKYKSYLQGIDHEFIPIFLSKILISNEEDLQDIIFRSKQLKRSLPISISKNLKSFDLFNLKKIDSFLSVLSNSHCLSMHPKEIMHLVYPEFKTCGSSNTCKLCCTSYPIIIIDCRPAELLKQGYFPNTELLFENIPEHSNAINEFPLRFLPIKGIYHFVLLGDYNQYEDFVKSFVNHEFPFISVVERGFNACHELVLYHKFEIKSHASDVCKYCKDEIKIVCKKPKNIKKCSGNYQKI